MNARLNALPRTLWLTLICVFAGLPVLWMALTSLQPMEELLGTNASLIPASASLDAYREVVTRFPFWQWFGNSVLVAGSVVAGNLVFDTLAAYGLSRIRFRGRQVVLTLILATLMIPTQVILVPLYLVMRDLGWIDTYWALIIPFLASPTGIFLLRQHFITLPIQLDEAAAIDGAGRIRTLWSVLLPSSWPALGTVAVLKFMWTWGEFAWPSLVTNNELLRTLPVGLARFQNQFDPRWDLLMAGSVMAAVPVVLCFILLQRFFVRGLTGGAVKE
ncbi:carbohydrate ABC transporter permease [Streptomyces sp. NBC_00513]|uniref:carbohydrate ABC transporter permease n=1 Tax=unclassified Streptomyces TaxID=2593676 RepID=UPI002259E08E|nr:carbohydrate ABC transporter permease [Streptomyces sp. NBC_00424]MCX5078696.1 carbohydrate ABC transporter permease [Streptomyces sp. NBC_00424]WUD39139.1 carbohydrate ABC transporter permease [Streptomyces sp. NBC_00513]